MRFACGFCNKLREKYVSSVTFPKSLIFISQHNPPFRSIGKHIGVIPVFGIAGVVHKCVGEVQLFPQFQVQPEADCMENGPRTVALCIECLRFHFVPVDVLGIPFPSEHVVDFVDGGYSKAVLVGKVKVELATVAAGQVVDAFVHLIIVAEGTSQKDGVEVGVTIYSPVSFEVCR